MTLSTGQILVLRYRTHALLGQVGKDNDSLPNCLRQKPYGQPDASDSAARAPGLVRVTRMSRRCFTYAAAALGIASAEGLGLRSRAGRGRDQGDWLLKPDLPSCVGFP